MDDYILLTNTTVQDRESARGHRSTRMGWARCTACLVAACAALAVPVRAFADNPESIIFSIGHTVVSLDARWIEPPPPPGTVVAQTAVPMPFSCGGINDWEGTDWTASLGETSKSDWRTFKCTSYDREVSLSIQGVGAYGGDGFVEMSYNFVVSWAENANTLIPQCIMRSQPGNVSGLPDQLLNDIFETTIAGKCEDWQLTAKITMLEGFAPFE